MTTNTDTRRMFTVYARLCGRACRLDVVARSAAHARAIVRNTYGPGTVVS